MLVNSNEIIKRLKISRQSLYYWRINNKLKFQKINGKYLYEIEDTNKNNIIYCRVSNTKQKSDLERQEKILREYTASNGYIINYVFKDIASGMNDDRKEFNNLINMVIEGDVSKVFISYKDRLTRFGFNYFNNLFKKFNTEIIVINLTKEEDFQNELTEDLISIIHHFSMKIDSNRRKELKEITKKLKDSVENN